MARGDSVNARARTGGWSWLSFASELERVKGIEPS